MLVEKTIALFAAMTEADVMALPPAQRRRFADVLKHWARIAERPATAVPKAGVLGHLHDGYPRHE